jgi:SAM-dependent methyltransferase
MQVSPYLYHWFVRPKWLTKWYIHDHIRRHFDLAEKRVLDFGAGTGANCCLTKPDQYIGIDPDAKRIAFAKRLFPAYEFGVLEGETLPLEDGSVDYVMVVAVLHHIATEQISPYLREFRRILKPGGRVIVMEPCLRDHTPLSNWFMRWNDRGDYIRDEDEYLGLFQQEGYACSVRERFKKCFLYNELFFDALPVQ